MDKLKPYKGMTPLERIMKKVDLTISPPCWTWVGYLWSTGYGAIRVNGKKTLVHRLMYSLFWGKIPDGFLVCHVCDNPLCVNPLHLFVGTNNDNVKDCLQKGRHKGVLNSPFKKGNTYGKNYWNDRRESRDV
jgi:hypothetical protein